MRIAHRKNVLFTDAGWWDTAINWCSGFGGFAHSELVFDNGESFSSTTEFDPATLIYPTALWMKSLGRKNGPLIRHIEFREGEWEFTELHLTDSQKLQLHVWCREQIDQSIKDRAGYDWSGVLRFVFKWMKEHANDWFCSEIVVTACQQVGYFRGEQAWKISPNKLRKLCRALEGGRA